METDWDTDTELGPVAERASRLESDLDEDLDADLESGIAAILTRLQNGETSPDAAPVPDPAITLALLGELDRLWRKPAA